MATVDVTVEVEFVRVAVGIASDERSTPVGAGPTNAVVATTIAAASGGQKYARTAAGVYEHATCHRPGTYKTSTGGCGGDAVDKNSLGY